MTDVSNFKSHYLELNGFRCHYLDEGNGEPLVLLHGNPSWSFMYRDLIHELRKDFRVIAFDHIGCGLSDKPSRNNYSYCLEQRALDLERILATLGISYGITLVMHDWGGPIGMAFATRHPEGIARLVALNTAAFLFPKGKRLHWSLQVARSRFGGEVLVRGLNLMSIGAMHLGCQSRLSRKVRRCYMAPYDSWRNRIAVFQFLRDIPLTPSHPSYAALRRVDKGLGQFRHIPLLICWGEKDFIFDSVFLDEWISRFPAAEVHRFPNAGHYILEDAGDAVSPLLRRFICKHPQGA